MIALLIGTTPTGTLLDGLDAIANFITAYAPWAAPVVLPAAVLVRAYLARLGGGEN